MLTFDQIYGSNPVVVTAMSGEIGDNAASFFARRVTPTGAEICGKITSNAEDISTRVALRVMILGDSS